VARLVQHPDSSVDVDPARHQDDRRDTEHFLSATITQGPDDLRTS
jgi:hypothetical protein